MPSEVPAVSSVETAKIGKNRSSIGSLFEESVWSMNMRTYIFFSTTDCKIWRASLPGENAIYLKCASNAQVGIIC